MIHITWSAERGGGVLGLLLLGTPIPRLARGVRWPRLIIKPRCFCEPAPRPPGEKEPIFGSCGYE